MPVIRQIESSVGLGGAPSPSIQVDDSIGQGLRSVGSSLSSAVQAEQQMQLRREQMAMQVSEFRADQSFRRFQDSLGVDLADAQQKMDPSGAGLTEGFVQRFDEQSSKFLEQVPAALRPKFDELVQTSRAGWVDRVAVQERDQRYSWFRTGIGETQEKLQGQVFNQPELFDAAKEDGLRAIDASGLPEAEKEELRKQWDEVLAVTLAEREIRDVEANPALAADAGARLGVPGATQNGGDALSLLREFEGFRETPYWDVNANRVGYGSDTVTDASGNVRRVTSNTRVSRADAERDLQRRAKEFEATAAGQVGAEAWQALPPNAQAALVSVAYNYGSLPPRVVNAVSTGDVASIAGAVQALGSDNGGVNRKRRAKEAAIIRGDTELANNAPDMSDPRYAALSLSQRLEIYDRTQAAADRGAAAIEAQKKAVNASTYDSLTLGVETGEVVSEQTILNSAAIDDGQKATLLKAFRAKREESAGVGELISAITSGDGVSINSFDSEQTKVGDKAFDQMIKAVPQENRGAVTRAFVQETGYIPKPEIAVIRAGVMTDDVAQLSGAMQNADFYQRAAPQQFASQDGLGDAREALSDYRYFTNDMGLSPDEAAAEIIRRRSPEVTRSEEVLGKEADKLLSNRTVEEVTGHFDTWYEWEPGAGATLDVQNQLMVEYRRAFRDEYLKTADEGVAKTRALDALSRTWGVSKTSGSVQMMKFPPEKAYPSIGGSHDYINADAMATAAQFAEGEVDRVALIPRPETRRDFEASRPPRYSLVYFEKGSEVPQMVPGTWAIPGDRLVQMSEESRATAMEASRQRNETLRQEAEREAQALSEGDAAMNPALPDWMQARQREQAVERRRQEITPAQAEETQRRIRATRTEGQQRQQFLERERGRVGNLLRGGWATGDQ